MSKRAKEQENEERMEEVRQITAELEEGHKGYMALWTKVKNVSTEDIKQIYIKLNKNNKNYIKK